MYQTCIEPLHHDDPRQAEKLKHKSDALNALRDAGIKPTIVSRSRDRVEQHAKRMDEILEPMNRRALVSRCMSLNV